MKNILLFTILIFSILNISACNKNQDQRPNDPKSHDQDLDQFDFYFEYFVSTRFKNTVIKEEVEQAESVVDLIPEKDSEIISSFYDIQVSTFGESRKSWVKARNSNEFFNKKQLEILKSLDNGSSFSITGRVKKTELETNEVKDDTIIYYLTVMPSQPAQYQDGIDELIRYLQINSEEAITIARKDKIKPGKISFVVTTEGVINEVELKYTSAYDSIDEMMLKLISNIPGTWQIALNKKGEKVDQELTFFFGIMGC